ncbi:hypothetical protein LC609_31180 [Nostoc sp. XA013]|nr:hypothetical protein [Nostoc sp. XA013]
MSSEYEELFYKQLVLHGVKACVSAKVAHILVSGQPDELITLEEMQLVVQACKHWAISHKQVHF